MTTIIKCDKCGSTAVERMVKTNNKEENAPEVFTMTQFAERDETAKPHVDYAIMHYNTYILFCRTCGHKLEYTPGTFQTTAGVGLASIGGDASVTHAVNPNVTLS